MTDSTATPLARTPGALLTRYPGKRPKVTDHRRRVTMARADGRCETCGDGVSYLEIDHIIPVILGGTNVLDNLRAVCWDCNHYKGPRLDCEAWA